MWTVRSVHFICLLIIYMISTMMCVNNFGVLRSDWSDLLHLRDRNVEDLSGGELQRFACAVVCIQRADM